MEPAIENTPGLIKILPSKCSTSYSKGFLGTVLCGVKLIGFLIPSGVSLTAGLFRTLLSGDMKTGLTPVGVADNGV